jgi:putative restriction endonuclease
MANEIYSRVKVRGVAQQIFKNAILMAYDGKCAFSGIPIKDTLEAVHIVPWSKCESKYRIHVGNGILLSSIHHKLFDKGMISLGENYIISVSKELLSQQHSSSLMSVLVSEINGKMMCLPKNKENWPLVELIKIRNKMKEH